MSINTAALLSDPQYLARTKAQLWPRENDPAPTTPTLVEQLNAALLLNADLQHQHDTDRAEITSLRNAMAEANGLIADLQNDVECMRLSAGECPSCKHNDYLDAHGA